ncbi:MAG: ABC transporter permease [Candidatus Dormibacteria bacterium]
MTTSKTAAVGGEIAPAADASPSPRPLGSVGELLRKLHGLVGGFLGAAIVLVLLVVLLTSTESSFLTSGNLKNVLITNSPLFVVAVGMTFVMISSGFDLSIGAMMAVSEVLLWEFLQLGVPSVVAIALVLVAGFLIGALVNGALVGVFGVNFFVATLGSMTLFYGIVDVVTNGTTEIVSSPTLSSIGYGDVLGVPIPIAIVLVALLGGGFVLRWTSFGRTVYAVGGNREAARLAGISTRWVVMAVYGIAGLCGAVAGVIDAGRLGAASPTDGSSIALISGAAVLLGGTSLFGGVGGLAGTIVGVLVIAVLGNGVNLLGVSNYWQGVVTGGVLIGAILLARYQGRGRHVH